MASIITASASSGLTQSADTSGVLQLASGVGNLVTIPSVTGTAMVSGNMPAFSAYASSSQSLSGGTDTKIQINTKVFDTNTNFDATTNYRFTPTVAGYYQVNGSVMISTTTITNSIQALIYKNGSVLSAGNLAVATASAYPQSTVSSLIFLNGSTDYIEFYGHPNTTLSTNAFQQNCYFQASMVRSA